jgi:hypothetical protein
MDDVASISGRGGFFSTLPHPFGTAISFPMGKSALASN